MKNRTTCNAKRVTQNVYRITYNVVIIIVLTLCIVRYTLHAKRVEAINMQSDGYRIQFGTINSGGQKMTDPVNNLYNLSTSVGQAAAKEFQSNGYIVKAGFQYINSRIPFTFSLSNIRIDLGTLLPNTPSTATLTLSVSFGGSGQYIVTARADAPLTAISGSNTVSFTACNGGADTCTITNAKLWTSTSAYGFGYGMAGEDTPADFSGNTLMSYTYYRPFANKLILEDSAPIMQSTNVTTDITPTPNPSYTPAPALTGVPHDVTHQATMTMKVNISGLQPAGTYATVIRFLATPSF